ncbi:MAG: zf-HC2 domain-containing protein [Parabacteroides sp.]|nr:zf-HC2 domain-containing protein [Parabacteroides sp.]
MKDCNKYNHNVLWAYLRDQLSVKEMIMVQYHLFSCNSCQKRIENMRKLSLAISYKQTNCKRTFNKRLRFYLGFAASFFISFLIGVSYYIISTNKNKEFPIEIRESPNYEELDSLKKGTDSLIILPDSISENKFDKKLSH